VTFLVPYDDSNLAKAALVRAGEYADALDEDVTALSVIPEDAPGYARRKDWVEDGDDFSVRDVAETLHDRVTDWESSAAFRYERASSPDSATIADEIQEVARETAPAVVFLGSDNVGEVATPVSVAEKVTDREKYDVHLVRAWSPTAVQQIETDTTSYPDT
jgi:nucleotide-binding universal stress UspA family protein